MRRVPVLFGLDLCQPSPCLNDNDCFPVLDPFTGQQIDYECRCDAGMFTGRNCEIRKLMRSNTATFFVIAPGSNYKFLCKRNESNCNKDCRMFLPGFWKKDDN